MWRRTTILLPKRFRFFLRVDDFEKTCEEYLAQIGRIKAAVSVPVIASLNGITPGGWTAYARLIEEAGADALELNYYDLPSNPKETGADVEKRALEMVRAVRNEVKIPIAVKLSPFFLPCRISPPSWWRRGPTAW